MYLLFPFSIYLKLFIFFRKSKKNKYKLSRKGFWRENDAITQKGKTVITSNEIDFIS